MAYDTVETLLGLGVVAALAVGSVLLLLRLGGRGSSRQGAFVVGYPSDLFPAHTLVQAGPLAVLATIQGRVLSIYRQIPPESETGLWLETFLLELREIMDTAYRVMVVTEVYGRPTQLDAVVAEVQQLEAQVAEHVTQRLLAREGDARDELLEARLETLRLCMEELAEDGNSRRWTITATEK